MNVAGFFAAVEGETPLGEELGDAGGEVLGHLDGGRCGVARWCVVDGRELTGQGGDGVVDAFAPDRIPTLYLDP